MDDSIRFDSPVPVGTESPPHHSPLTSSERGLPVLRLLLPDSSRLRGRYRRPSTNGENNTAARPDVLRWCRATTAEGRAILGSVRCGAVRTTGGENVDHRRRVCTVAGFLTYHRLVEFGRYNTLFFSSFCDLCLVAVEELS